MKQATDAAQSESPASVQQVQLALQAKQVCPFCGTVRDKSQGPCIRCTMEDTPATRQATKTRIGPWYVLQTRNPAAPGMRFTTLLSLVRKGQVTSRSIVRGPTTHQLWCFATQVKGLSREFGVCHSCAEQIESTANLCPHCQRLQEPPINPDVLLEAKASSDVKPILADAETASAETAAMMRVPDLTPRRPASPEQQQGILTAKELATAFHLEFKPAAPRMPRRSLRLGRVLLVLLLLGGAGVGAAMYFDPTFREQATDWLSDTTQTARTRLAALTGLSSPSKTPAPVGAVPSQSMPDPLAATDRPPRLFSPPPANRALPEAGAARPPVEPFKADPILPAAANPVPYLNPLPPVAKIEIPQIEVAEFKGEPRIASHASEPDLTREMQQARNLWAGALDAEAKGQFAEAIKRYETIKKLPREVWQSSLELNLELARKRLNGQKS